MEVVYSSEGHQTIHIGARLPFEGETVESVIKMYAPVLLWLDSSKSVNVPAIGQRGYIDPNLKQSNYAMTAEEIEAQRTADMWAQVQFDQKIASTLLRLGVLTENPTAIPVAEL
jgi:hypothetical protein